MRYKQKSYNGCTSNSSNEQLLRWDDSTSNLTLTLHGLDDEPRQQNGNDCVTGFSASLDLEGRCCTCGSTQGTDRDEARRRSAPEVSRTNIVQQCAYDKRACAWCHSPNVDEYVEETNTNRNTERGTQKLHYVEHEHLLPTYDDMRFPPLPKRYPGLHTTKTCM